MTVRIYRSTDSSAPSMTGQAGQLITVLDAVLVNGYGSQTAAGWTKSFAGTNTATYRLGGGTQFYLNVNDNGPGAGTFKEARAWGSETASAVLTGTNLFPTVAQQANGLFIRKSTTADSTTRTWIIAADAITCHMFILTGDSATTYYSWSFGDLAKQGTDTYNCMFIARSTENSGSTAVNNLELLSSALTSTTTGHYMPRAYTGVVGAINNGVHTDTIKNGAGTSMGAGGSAAIQYLNGIDGGLYIAEVWIHEPNTLTIRGRLRGLWCPCHNASSYNDADTFSGSGALAGRTFQILKFVGTSGVIALETSDTWNT